MAVDGQQRQSSTDYRPTSPQQPHPPKFPIAPLLPRSDEGGPGGGASLHSDQHAIKTHSFQSKEKELPSSTTEHPSRNLHSTGDSQEDRCHRRAGTDLPSTKNRIDPARLGKVDRIQHRSERNNSGLVPQSNVQVWNEPSLSPNTRTTETTFESNSYLESEEEVSP
ncbi:hypothetical protein A4A49_63636, partial [Nicotiana attenuata]